MKSGVAAMVIAALRLAGSAKGRGGLTLVFTAGEETGSQGAAQLAGLGDALGDADAIVVGEAVYARIVAAIDLNSDLGESYGTWKLGDDDAMLDAAGGGSLTCLRTISLAVLPVNSVRPVIILKNVAPRL